MKKLLILVTMLLTFGFVNAQKLMNGSRSTIGYIENEKVMNGSRSTIGYIENGLENRTADESPYGGMFQQKKSNAKYAALLLKYNDGRPTNKGCEFTRNKTGNFISLNKQTQYGVKDFKGYVLESFKIKIENWGTFKTQVNWGGN